MKYDKKLMKSHSAKYRMIQIPHNISAAWVQGGVERVIVEHVEKGDYLIVRPQKPKKQKATASTTVSANMGVKQDHSAANHFGINRIGFE